MMEHAQSVQQRQKRNLILFIVSYVINNLASGILYDTYVNYLQEVSLSTATSFWAFYGYATFLSAFILLLVPKSGYKKLLLFCAAATSAAFFCVVYIKSEMVLSVNPAGADRRTAAFHHAGSVCGSLRGSCGR